MENAIISDLNTLLGGGLLAGICIAAWDYIKIYFAKIYGLFFVRIKLNTDELQHACVLWSFNKCKQSKITLLNYFSNKNFIKNLNKTQLIAYEQPSNEPTIYFYKCKPIIISSNGELVYLRWTFKANDLIKEMVSFYNEKMGDNINSY